MNKTDYLSLKYIDDFIDWMIPRIAGEISFSHSYISNRSKRTWKCDSIYNAFANYRWRFKSTLPEEGVVRGASFKESERVLSIIESGMKLAIENNDPDRLLEYSRAMLEWGGVMKSNYQKLESMGAEIVNYYKTANTSLNPITVDSEDDFDGIYMNSGFTKLYSILLDDFVIYDSRVGASLGLLVRKFLEDNLYDSIPDGLNFSYGNSRPTKSDAGNINKRNPSSEMYKFTQLANNRKKHIRNNIYANWLLTELAGRSKFSELENPVRALEAALFMIGYEVNSIGELPA